MSCYVIPRAPIGPVGKNVVSDPPFWFRPCCHVVAVALLNKEFKWKNCDITLITRILTDTRRSNNIKKNN